MLAGFALFALVAVGCGEGAGPPSASPQASPFAALPTLTSDVFAIGWDGVGEPQVVRQVPLPAGYEVETVADSLPNPVGLAFLPDGRLLVGEQQTGRIRVIEDGKVREEPFAVVEHVVQGRLELGLLGIAVDPDFRENRWVYAFYVEADDDGEPRRSVLLRITAQEGVAGEQTVLAQFPAPATDKHVGGGLEFGPDGKLYLTIGDTDRKRQVADLSKPVGKIFRLNRDGSAPNDNPLVDRDGADSRVFAYGFRNLFDVAFHPDLPGRLIAPDNAVGEFDEINIVRPGGNYGWPQAFGIAGRQGLDDPLWVYLQPVAPAGMTVYSGERLAEFQGDLFFCQFTQGGALHRLRFSDDFQSIASDTVIATGCSASVAQGPDSFLYFTGVDPEDPDHGRVLRIVRP